jgi:putative hemolysin
VDGLVPVADLRRVITLPEGPGKETQMYSTVAGFVLARMGRIPSAGEFFRAGDLRFEILDMDGKRIDRVLIVHAVKRGDKET